MSLTLNKSKLNNLAGDIWKSAERLRGKFKAYEFQNVVLPIIVIRRLECVLIKWREDKAAEVLAKRPKLTTKALAESGEAFGDQQRAIFQQDRLDASQGLRGRPTCPLVALLYEVPIQYENRFCVLQNK
jgi:type I restriction-modification system DNA methylase subunit